MKFLLITALGLVFIGAAAATDSYVPLFLYLGLCFVGPLLYDAYDFHKQKREEREVELELEEYRARRHDPRFLHFNSEIWKNVEKAFFNTNKKAKYWNLSKRFEAMNKEFDLDCKVHVYRNGILLEFAAPEDITLLALRFGGKP